LHTHDQRYEDEIVDESMYVTNRYIYHIYFIGAE
jgi:hypothetical protein